MENVCGNKATTLKIIATPMNQNIHFGHGRVAFSFSFSPFDCCKAFFRASSTSSNNSSSSHSSYTSSSMISECVCLSFLTRHPTSCLLIVFPLVPSQNFYLGQLIHLVYHKKSSTHYITFHRLNNNGNLESAHRHHNIFVYPHTMSYMD